MCIDVVLTVYFVERNKSLSNLFISTVTIEVTVGSIRVSGRGVVFCL